MSLYNDRGVSAQKEEVHAATKHLDKGLFPNAFCQIHPDYLSDSVNFGMVSHADGAGTKSITAYMYWKQTGDISVFRGISQDAIVMNLDDLICSGIYNNIVYSSTIDRNKNRITGDVLGEVINGNKAFFDTMKPYGLQAHLLGGETADLGDVVRTMTVNGTMTARWPLDKIITNDKIQPGDVIVGLASFGQSTYETGYNSGIGSNGLTSARHDLLSKKYLATYPETVEPDLRSENNNGKDILYVGKHDLQDMIDVGNGQQVDVGHLILSPTRTYLPIVKDILENDFDIVHGLIHCSGGGQTKCMKYLPQPMRIVKDNMFDTPPIFQLIQQASGVNDKEMHETFNMGHRMEVFTSAEHAQKVIDTAAKFNVAAQIVGRVETSPSGKNELIIKPSNGGLDLVY